MNFFVPLNFFPLLFSQVFPPDPVQVGLKGLAPGLSTTFGAVLVNAALSWFKGHNRELHVFATVLVAHLPVSRPAPHVQQLVSAPWLASALAVCSSPPRLSP
jgi:hypothetical protein